MFNILAFATKQLEKDLHSYNESKKTFGDVIDPNKDYGQPDRCAAMSAACTDIKYIKAILDAHKLTKFDSLIHNIKYQTESLLCWNAKGTALHIAKIDKMIAKLPKRI